MFSLPFAFRPFSFSVTPFATKKENAKAERIAEGNRIWTLASRRKWRTSSKPFRAVPMIWGTTWNWCGILFAAGTRVNPSAIVCSCLSPSPSPSACSSSSCSSARRRAYTRNNPILDFNPASCATVAFFFWGGGGSILFFAPMHESVASPASCNSRACSLPRGYARTKTT